SELCPDPGEWAALAEGQVADARRPALEAHLAQCEPCLATLLGLEAERTAAPARASARQGSRPLRLFRPAVAAAAVLLVALAATVFIVSRREPTEPRDSIELALARLAEAHPTLAASVAELTAAERAALVPAPARGGVRALLPQGLVLEGRPRVRVPPVPGARAYLLRVTDAEGRVVAEATLAAPDAPWPSGLPALAPGQEYVASVEAEGPTGRVRALGAFRTAGGAEAQAHADAQAALAGVTPRGVSALLGARRLLRLSSYEAAERELALALADPASAAEARALLDALEARIGR
ncbi:MAG TPA: hypothetical protein VND21_07005, partial [Planctomycetota bacterium]|nr:hypothetical protein [Planctomycetota bacterium]